MATVEDIHANRGKWIALADKMGSPSPEDAVQDMIEHILTYGRGDDTEAYFYYSLRYAVIKQCKREQKHAHLDLDDVQPFEENEPHYFDEIKPDILKALDDEHPYYVWLYRVYTSREYNSMRKISDCTGISLMTIFRDITKIKEFIKNKV